MLRKVKDEKTDRRNLITKVYLKFTSVHWILRFISVYPTSRQTYFSDKIRKVVNKTIKPFSGQSQTKKNIKSALSFKITKMLDIIFNIPILLWPSAPRLDILIMFNQLQTILG